MGSEKKKGSGKINIDQDAGIIKDNGSMIGLKADKLNVDTINVIQSGSSTAYVQKKYLETLKAKCLKLSLEELLTVDNVDDSVDVTSHVDESSYNHVTLKGVFIELNAQPLAGQDVAMHSMEKESMPITSLVHDQDKVVLLGDPGSGKTSWVRHMIANVAESILEKKVPQLANAGGLLPIYIELRELAAGLEKLSPQEEKERKNTLLQYLVDHVVANAFYAPHDSEEFRRVLRQELGQEKLFIVFDGLDEVPLTQQSIIRDLVEVTLDLPTVQRTIITCRIRSYSPKNRLKQATVYTIAKLDEPKVKEFIRGWYAEQVNLGVLLENEAGPLREDLERQALQAPFKDLSETPLLLTTMAILHQRNTRLPRERVQLYRMAVDLLMNRWSTGNRKQVKLHPKLLPLVNEPARLRPLIEQLAYAAHETGQGDDQADLTFDQAKRVLKEGRFLDEEDPFEKEALARRLLDYFDKRAGIMIGRGAAHELPPSYSFPHRTFQEYLAGCFALNEKQAETLLPVLAEDGDRWAVAIELGIEEMIHNPQRKAVARIKLLADELTEETPRDVTSSRLALWGAKMADVIQLVADSNNKGLTKSTLSQVKERTVQLMSSALPPIERAEAGRILARLGDPREEVTTIKHMQFCFVPAGSFLMGEDAKRMEIPYDYWISQYPVTNAQFEKFVLAKGYERQNFWTKAGWSWKQENAIIRPASFGDIFSLSNHPVVGVSWYEAMAYVCWLQNEKLLPSDWLINLPNDPEWEKAARGGEQIPLKPGPAALHALSLKKNEISERTNVLPSRRYCWEGEDAKTDRMNYSETKLSTTSASGCFIGGESPYGVHEMNGQVWEWLRNRYAVDFTKMIVMKGLEAEDIESTSSRVLRGGAFLSGDNDCRCAVRLDLNPVNRLNVIGFRIVLRPPR